MQHAHDVIGLYGDPTAIVADPHFLDVAQGEIGLNRLIFGGPFNLSAQTRALNPVAKDPQHLAPGLGLTEDDSTLHRALDGAHQRGIKVWGIISSYWAGAENEPDLMARDLNGRRMDEFPPFRYAAEQATYTFCPNNERVNAWFEAALVELASRYGFDGFALTHFRYSHAAFFQEMLACGCDNCRAAAAEMGYDFERMKKAMLGSVNALQHASARDLKRAAGLSMSATDLLHALGSDAGGVADWFNFRADTITRNLKRFKTAVQGVTGPQFAFGSDVYYPSLSMLVGHRYQDFAATCEHILPLLPHFEIHCLDVLASLATLLTQWAPGLEERDALRLVYQLFGYDQVGLPESIAALHLGNPPQGEPDVPALSDLIASEMSRVRLLSGDTVKSYPVIKGAIWPAQTIQRLVDAAHETGHNGVVFQGTDALFTYSR